MNAATKQTNGAFTFQVSHADIGPLYTDLLRVECDENSPLAGAVARYTAGSQTKHDKALAQLANLDAVGKAATIVARADFIMANRIGGGATPLNFFTACRMGADDAFAVVSPSFRGAYLFQLFESVWTYLAWWLSQNASLVNEPSPNRIPPPTSFESLIYLLHAVDLYRRVSFKSQLEYSPTDHPSLEVDAFSQTLQASIKNGDLRWLLPAFLGLMPSLDRLKFHGDPQQLEVLAKLDFLFPAKSTSGSKDYDRLVFGEAGRAMGTEFFRTWFRAVGFETKVRVGSSWKTLHRGFLAPTGITNHLVLLEEGSGGESWFNHQAMTRDALDTKMAHIVERTTTVPSIPGNTDLASRTGAQEPGAQIQKFCTSCGSELRPRAKFCGDCGASVT